MTEKKQKQPGREPYTSLTPEQREHHEALRRLPPPVPVSEAVLLLDRSRDVVRALLVSFGLPGFDAPPAIKTRRALLNALAGLENDAEAYGRRHHEELLQARVLAEKLVRRLSVLRGPSLAHPDAYKREWKAVVNDWNEAAEKKRWLTLPRLCGACGKPIIGRKAVALGNGAFELSNTCSEECRETVKKSAWRRRQRER